MDSTLQISVLCTANLTVRVPRSNESVDWSKTPPVIGAKAWYWDPIGLTSFTYNTDDESNWRRWPRTNLLGVVIYHRDPARPTIDYRTIEIGYDYVRVPGMPANVETFEGVWIDDTNWEIVRAAMRADTWRPA